MPDKQTRAFAAFVLIISLTVDFPVYPVKAEKKARTIKELNVFFCVENGRIVLHKRSKKGLLSSLWELPNADRDRSIPEFLQEIGILQAEIIPMRSQKHIFTHIEWHMDCYYIKVKEKTDSEMIWITEEDAAENYALPSAFRKTWTEGLKTMHTKK